MEDFVKIDKLYRLFGLALDDLQKAERDRNVVIDMSYWHYFKDDGRCSVCMAGAVLIGSLGWSKCLDSGGRVGLPMWEFGEHAPLKSRLTAIDYLRTGNVSMAYLYLTPDDIRHGHAVKLNRRIAGYPAAWPQWWALLQDLCREDL